MYVAGAWRARWRSLLVVAAMVALTAGFGAAALAGARRSDSSPDRFRDAAHSRDMFISESSDEPDGAPLDELLDGPLVAEELDVRFLFAFPSESLEGDVVGFAPTDPDERAGLVVDRGVLQEGRWADPTDPDELVVPEVVARRFEVGPGDTLPVATFTPAQAAAVSAGEPLGPPEGPVLDMRVVGVARTSDDLAAARTEEPSSLLYTPAFLPRYGDEVGVGADGHLVRFADGAPDAAERFTDALHAAYRGREEPGLDVSRGEQSQLDAISVITVALVALGLTVVVAGLVWIVSAVARLQRLATADLDILRALGSTRGQRLAVALATVAPGLVAGTLLAPLVAIALSPLFPVGLARRFDPSPGLHADLVALAAVPVGLLAVAGLATLASGLRLLDRRPGMVPAAGTPGGGARRTGLGDLVGRRLGPAPATGVRFALAAPRDLAVPVRPALVGALTGVLGLVAVAVVGASLDRLVDTPGRWGANWDAALTVRPSDAGVDPVDPEVVLDDPDVEAAAFGRFDEQATIAGHEALATTIDPLKGDLGLTVVDGRAPRGDDEVAVGRETLDALGVPLGSEVEVTGRSDDARETYRVVGVVLFPTVDYSFPLADGVAFTREGGDRIALGDPDRDDAGLQRLLVRWAPGVDRTAAVERLVDAAVAVDPQAEQPVVAGPIAPPEVEGLGDVELFPVAAAAALVVLGVISTSHALVVTVRRRRAELGVLSALGFTPRQRRTVITAQATTVACAALLFGVPLGALTGRVVWAAIAGSLGVAGDAAFPLALLLVGVPAVLLVLNLIGALPARSAARLRVAEALRTE
jgi:hypothetical protein